MAGSEPLIQKADPHITQLTVELECRIRWSKKNQVLIQEADPHITQLTVELECRIRWSKKNQVVITIQKIYICHYWSWDLRANMMFNFKICLEVEVNFYFYSFICSRLRMQSWPIRLGEETWSATPILQYLNHGILKLIQFRLTGQSNVNVSYEITSHLW